MTINPQDAKPDQPYKVTLDGERYVAMRNNPRKEFSEWRLIPKPGVQALWAGDGAVKNLTPLVPARNITRDDLPSEEDIQALAGQRVSHGESTWGLVLDAVVAHLNERGGVPAEKLHPEMTMTTTAFPSDEGGSTMEDRIKEALSRTDFSFAKGGTVQRKSCCEEAQLTAAELARRN